MPPIAPRKLDLKKDERLRVEWADGRESIFPVRQLRLMCPCAACKIVREGTDPHQLMRPATPAEIAKASGRKSLSLNVLPEQSIAEDAHVEVTQAEMVGNYALKLTFSDGHQSGIFSWTYLRELADRP